MLTINAASKIADNPIAPIVALTRKDDTLSPFVAPERESESLQPISYFNSTDQ
jgi:hypothetical protein